MKTMIYRCLIILPLFFSGMTFAQQGKEKLLDDLFSSRGEVCFTFKLERAGDIDLITRIISVDDVRGRQVFAYANRQEFSAFLGLGIPYTVLPNPSSLVKEEDLNMGNVQTDANGLLIWNFYPTYDQYLGFMADFAAQHPAICRLDTIGYSVQGRLLLKVRISDSVDYDLGKPEIFYTSSIHGDEIAGYVLMLHLIDYLLSGYGTDPRITAMINTYQININPLANPDGTYHGGNNTVNGAQRYNANNVDLNRNFPDPQAGPHPDGYDWQAETVAFMALADSTHFTASLNFHGGSEVFNYPWDTWQKLHADDAWWQFVAREYADTVHAHSPAGYFTDLNNGITNGYAWYQITGGRQDYTTYFHYGREATLEISHIKMLPANQLLNWWGYNYRSFLNYMDQAYYGINGKVTDSVTGEPVRAKVFISGHDFDNSFVYSGLPGGWYYRPIINGNYTLVFSAPDYFSKTLINQSVSKFQTTRLNVRMIPLNIGTGSPLIAHQPFIYPNPSDGRINVIFPGTSAAKTRLEVFNMLGIRVYETFLTGDGRVSAPIDLQSLSRGIYLARMTEGPTILENKIVIR